MLNLGLYLMSCEEWRDIPGYECIYQVSNLGNVKRLARQMGPGRGSRFLKEGFLRQSELGYGYLSVNLLNDGRFYVHRLMMAAFVGPCPDGHDVCHNDGNRQNNVLENLRYDTKAGNMADKKIHGTYLSGEVCVRAKLSNEQVEELRKRYASCEPTATLAEEFGVTAGNVTKIARGELYRLASGPITHRGRAWGGIFKVHEVRRASCLRFWR